MRITCILFLFILLKVSCTTPKEERPNFDSEQISFDRTKWLTKEGTNYPYRRQMVDAILYNDTIRTLNKNEILENLGEPDRENENHLYYKTSETKFGLFPLSTKFIVIKFIDDETIEWIKTHG